MEIRVLKYFLAVAREESISGAAEVLHITQPTLSRQLMRLEKELGATLFKRGGSKISLTDDGMLLRRKALDIVSLVDRAELELTGRSRFMEGEITIGSGETYSMSILAGIIKAFHSEYPLVKYNLYSGIADDIKERIDKGLVDIGLLVEPADIAKYDFVRISRRDRWGVLVRRDSPLADRETVTARDLLAEKLIISGRQIVRREMANWFGEYYDRLDVIASFNLIYNASMMVENGMGVALCLDGLASGANFKLCFRPMSPEFSTGTVIVWRKDQIFPAVVSKLIERINYALKA